MKERSFVATIALVFLCAAGALRAAETHEGALDFLTGSWSGSGSGDPGQGSGSFSFGRELDDRVLVRRAHSEYPASQGRSAVVHDDLLIVYADGSKAIYFDNEGHVIHYDVVVTSEPAVATFLSSDPPPSPRFRLTYTQVAADELEVVFEVASPDDRTKFQTYVKGTVAREQPAED
jgi:hypothetical protein